MICVCRTCYGWENGVNESVRPSASGEAGPRKRKRTVRNQRTNSSTLLSNDRMYSETKGVLISSRCILDTMC